jgi:hypothetical protein
VYQNKGVLSMEGMLKEVSREEDKKEPQIPVNQSLTTTNLFEGIPIDIYNYFDVPPGSNLDARDKTQLKEIYEWAKDGSRDIGDVLDKLSKVEAKLGQPGASMRRFNKIFNYVSIKRSRDRVLKHREAAIKNLDKKSQDKIKDIENKSKAQIQRVKKQASKEASAIQDYSAPEIQKLTKMQKAYER